MQRARLSHIVKDSAGNVVRNASVTVRQTGTAVNITDTMYAADTGATVLTNPLISNAQGEVKAYFQLPGTHVPGAVDLLVEDNANTAYYPSDPSTLLDFALFTETVEVRRYPDMPWVDLKTDCGAVGNSIVDDTAAVQKAIDALDDGNKIVGRVFCPSQKGQVYKISSPINIGDGTKYVAIEFIGQNYYGASNGPIQAVQFRPDDANENAFNLKAPNGFSHSFNLKGIQVKYASVGTGVGFDATGGDQMAALTMENCLVQNAGVGIKLGGSVNARFSNVSALTCGKGWVLTSSAGESPNLPQFENCYAQSCVTAGFSVEGPVSGARFDSCVFQSNAGPGILIADVAYLRHPTFTSCWWEFPGSDMIRVDGVGAGYALDAASFEGCRFDGSSGAGGRHVINNNAADGSSAMVRGLNIVGCEVANLNGGKFTNLVNADPSASNDPCFVNLTVTGLKGAADFEGIATAASHPTQFSIFSGNHDLTEANIITNAVLATKPRHMFNSGSVYISGPATIVGATDITGTATVSGALTVGGTVQLPTFTTAGRPAGAAGQIIYDSDVDEPMVHDGTAFTRTRSLWIPASDMSNNGDGTSAFAVVGAAPDGRAVWGFDEATSEGVVFTQMVPDDWTLASAMNLFLYYVGTTDFGATESVRWRVSRLHVGSLALIDAAATQVTRDDDPGVNADAQELVISPAFALGTPAAARDIIRVDIARFGAHANDDYAGAVHLVGARLDYTANR